MKPLKLLPTISLNPPTDRYVEVAVYDCEEQTIYLNYAKLRSHPLFLFRVLAHELLHHVFSEAAKRDKVDIDSKRWRFLNWKWNWKLEESFLW